MNTKLLKTLRGVGKAGLILTVMLCVAIFCGCAGEAVDSAASARENAPGEGGTMHERGTFEGLSAETEGRILQDYFDAYIKTDPGNADATVNDIWVAEYYGTYNDCIVVNVRHGWGYAAVVCEEVIEGIRFSYDLAASPVVWKEGQLYTNLQSAYDAGLWTLDDLKNLANYLAY